MSTLIIYNGLQKKKNKADKQLKIIFSKSYSIYCKWQKS